MPILVIVDHDVTGDETDGLVASIRNLPNGEKAKILIQAPVSKVGLRAGSPDGFIIKPIDPWSLRAGLRRLGLA